MIRCFRSWTYLLATGMIASGSLAFGQGNTFNPYGNSGYADYREFTTPMYANDPSLPGQARLQSGIGGRSRANQFESFSSSLDGSNADQLGSNRSSASGIPYYRANRLLDKDNRRSYQPNNTPADRQFQERLKARDTAYMKALEEKDPIKRARAMQKIDRDALDQPLTSNNRPATAKSKTAKSATARPTQTPAAGRTAPATTAAPASRTTQPAAATAGTPTPATPAAVDPASVPIAAPR